jgi:hypothetical protein
MSRFQRDYRSIWNRELGRRESPTLSALPKMVNAAQRERGDFGILMVRVNHVSSKHPLRIEVRCYLRSKDSSAD